MSYFAIGYLFLGLLVYIRSLITGDTPYIPEWYEKLFWFVFCLVCWPIVRRYHGNVS